MATAARSRAGSEVNTPASPGSGSRLDPLPVTASTNEALRKAVRRDLLSALGLPDDHPAARIVATLAAPAIRAFCQQAQGFDRVVARHGMAAAAAHQLDRWGVRVEAGSAPELPAEGPLLVLANHPGMSDTLALMTLFGQRSDARFLAERNAMLTAMPALREHLLFLDAPVEPRPRGLRRAARHLREGGALVLFPAGRIEPDPALHPSDAAASLERWSESAALLMRRVPELRVAVVTLHGVIHPRAQGHWLTRLRRTREGRERLGAMLQFVLPRLRRVQVALRGELLDTRNAPEEDPRGRMIMEHVRRTARRLLV